MKFSEPQDKAIPSVENGDLEWCLFEFKDDMLVEGKEPMKLQSKSAFLFGKDKKACDFALENPSIS